MAEYKDIHGTNIETVTSDPSNPIVGQMWYNSTSRTLKGFILSAASWASGGNFNADGHFQAGGAGIQTAGLITGGGSTWPGVGLIADTETYNGSSWTEVNNLNSSKRNMSGLGLTTAALICGGGPPAKVDTETWNGTSWTEVNNLNTAKDNNPGVTGILTAGIAFAGEGSPGAKITNAETFNGTSWTETGDLNTGRHSLGAAGTYTACLGFGGAADSPANGGEVESWNGTSWTEIADLNTNGREGVAGFGSQTSALASGGSTVNVELWNGSSWSEQNNLPAVLSNMGPAQNSPGSLGMVAGGFYGPGINVVQTTYEWTGEVQSTVTFDVS